MKRTINIILILVSLAVPWQARTAGEPTRHDTISFPSVSLYAQEATKPAADTAAEPARHADTSSVLYQVAGVILIIWLGLAIFLYRIDRRVTRLEKRLPETKGKDS